MACSHDCGGAMRPLPNLVLIGTRKAGTTALSALLLHHPHLTGPDCSRSRGRVRWTPRARRGMCVWHKEVRFFSRGGAAGVDICWYRERYACPPPRREAHAVYDGSPDYFVLPEAEVARMAHVLPPRALLVAMLRNPVDRFYSAYNMGMGERKRRRGQRGGAAYAELAASLGRWIECAPACPSELGIVNLFFEYGLYARHLSKFYRHFRRERVLLIKSEDFFRWPWGGALQVFEFAGLAPPTSNVSFTSSNSSILNQGAMWGQNYSGKLRWQERAQLARYYLPHNLDLYKLVGRNFGWEVGVLA